jgi:hypothetical protein
VLAKGVDLGPGQVPLPREELRNTALSPHEGLKVGAVELLLLYHEPHHLSGRSPVHRTALLLEMLHQNGQELQPLMGLAAGTGIDLEEPLDLGQGRLIFSLVPKEMRR